MTDGGSQIPMAMSEPDPGEGNTGRTVHCAMCGQGFTLWGFGGFVFWYREGERPADAFNQSFGREDR